MSFFGRLFGAPEAITTIIDKVSGGLDSLVYTDQEKAEDAAKDRQEARSMVIQWMSATSGQNLARRLIALSITALWLMMYFLAVVMNMAAVWITGSANQLEDTAKIAFDAAADMNPAVMLILAFYFAAPHMGQIASAVVGKFTKSMDRTG